MDQENITVVTAVHTRAHLDCFIKPVYGLLPQQKPDLKITDLKKLSFSHQRGVKLPENTITDQYIRILNLFWSSANNRNPYKFIYMLRHIKRGRYLNLQFKKTPTICKQNIIVM